MGTPLLPWQAELVRVGTELDGERFARRTVLATVPRQSGKTVVVQAVMLERMLAEGGQYGIYIAHRRNAGAARLRDMGRALVRSGLDPRAKVTLGVGNERLLFSNGSMVEVQSPNEGSTHGESVDLAVLDEAWSIDEVVLDGVLPAMSARARSQLWMISTAGTVADSLLLNRYCDLARSDVQGSIAFLEYSMPEDAHPFDVQRWLEWMPALGLTVDEATIRDQMDKLDAGKFRRAYGNIPTATEGEAIPLEWWAGAAASRSLQPGISIAVDASARGSAVATASQLDDGSWHVDPWEWRDEPDAGWTVGVVRDLMRYVPAVIAFDPSSPAGAAHAELQRLADDAAIPLRKFTLRDRALADQFFYESLREQQLTHSTIDALDAAIEGVVTVTYGDLWRFDRSRSLADISPLVACSLALYAAQESEALAPQVAIY